MATQDTGTPTPAEVKKLATKEVKLERVALIGIFGTAEKPSALIRLPKGNTVTVAIGDELEGGVVAAIGAGQLVLARSGRQYVMRMPAG